MRRLLACLACAALALVLMGCGGSAASREPAVMADLAQYPASDMSGFVSLAEHEGDLPYRDVAVADVAQMMDADESFALFFAYPGCPWCELLVSPMAEAATRADVELAFINTRLDPSWKSNLDIDDYDLFVERFGDYLDEDESGVPHLYVPDAYIVRNGEIVAHRDGVLAGHDDAAVPLSEEELAKLASELDAFLGNLG